MRKLIERLRNSRGWNVALWAVIVGFLIFSLLSIQSKEEGLKLKCIEVRIEPEGTLAFLDSAKVLELIKGADSGSLQFGLSQKTLKLDKMESSLEQYPFIEKADVSIDLSGKLMIKVLQRNPILRITNKSGQSYYVAKNGFKMPLHDGFAPRVLVANGNIAESLTDSAFIRSSACSDLLKIASFCNDNAFWQAQIEQLYVDNYMDIILIPKVGNHSIVFGSAEHLDEKFKLLKTFYLKGLNVIGWNKYTCINLKFEGQIVAEKNAVAQDTQTAQTK